MENSKVKKWFLGEVKIGYHRNEQVQGQQIQSSTDAIRFFRQLMTIDVIEHHEEFWVAYLNRANRVIGFMQVSRGGTHATVVDVKHVLQGAIGSNACGMLVMHNHPSGNLSPSEEDKKLTKKLQQACELFDITMLDHIILTADNSFSFADENML